MRFVMRHKILSIVLILVSIYIYLNYTMIISGNPKIDRTSKFYTNDIYMSDARIYKKLSKQEKQAYDEIMDMVKKRERKRVIDLSKYGNISASDGGPIFLTAAEAILLDHPELLQYATAGYSYRSDNNELKVNVEYAINNPIMEEVNTLKIQRIINKIKLETSNMSDLEKIKYVYEWVGDNSKYDTLFTYASKNQSIYNVFIKKNAVCAGFAKTSQVIFQNIGIESIPIVGETTGPHMWNIIKYNGKYYYYDSTYAASIRDKKNPNYYDGLKQEELNDHRKYHTDWYPKIETTSGIYK